MTGNIFLMGTFCEKISLNVILLMNRADHLLLLLLAEGGRVGGAVQQLHLITGEMERHSTPTVEGDEGLNELQGL